MKQTIEIIDRGRGMQLSTSRITMQDLVPYFQDACSPEEIRRWIPILTVEEIAVAQAYYHSQQQELDDQDKRIKERSAQRRNSPEVEEILERGREKLNSLREQFRSHRHGERNGDSPTR